MLTKVNSQIIYMFMSNYYISSVTESWFGIGDFLLIKTREHGHYLLKYVLNDHKLYITRYS
jgi:hypothetical protein